MENYKVVYESDNGKVEQIADNHFKITTALTPGFGSCSFELRHATLEEAIAKVEN